MDTRLRLSAIAAAIAMGFQGGAHAQTNKELAAEVKQLRSELLELRGELQKMKQAAVVQPAPAAVAATPASTPVAPVAPSAPAPAAAQAPAPMVASTPQLTSTGEPLAGDSTQRVSLFGYGEMAYSRPRNDASAASATLTRGVLGWAYQFNERTRFAAELEIENAVASSSDRGEVALEQFYVERDLTNSISAKAGLFLLPVGYLNETHEPTRYYGVFRNFIETAIIPTTWRELGAGFRGTTDFGLRWDAGATTSFDLTKWDPTSNEGRDSPLASIHQEGQLAKARNIGLYGALNYNGIPGFNVGASVFDGGVGQKQPGFAAPDAKVTLGEAHVRWQPGRWDLAALAATGKFSNVEALNATFAGQPTPVPNRFGGWYVQSAYRLWSQGEYAITPFARYERYNTANSYAGLAPGLAPAIQPDTRVWTLGASFFVTPQVVFKADYQRFLSDSSLDRFNLGLGLTF
ncbi:OprO/OprP family phosphate-selective porin [Variovorax sp. YR216]|uniref:OprO/OprP family phosphate-selective porin n=1 Tax=Variovorax sp. YR216 TaxID=1882828 RepID=UPI00089A6B6C|nr:OprO/OprP family phosphate-selective porin [Variovorax sp. YR216]SEB26578.1 hypothetical protein SAMN05444680_1356 [Variovorax sp. YR216]